MDSWVWKTADRGWPLLFALADLLLAGLFCLESWEFFLIQAGLLALGMILAGIAVFFSKRLGHRRARLIPLAPLVFFLGMALWEMAHPRDFLSGSLAAALYLFLSVHYLVGWWSVSSLFREENEENKQETRGH